MNKRWKKIVLYAAALIIAILAIFVYWITWTGSTDHIESVADQFKADSSWELVGSYADPPRTVCLQGGCPSLDRFWTTPEPITQEELARILELSGWEGVLPKQECLDDAKNNPAKYVCPVYGDVDKYSVSIYVDELSSIYKKPSVTMFINER